MLYTPCMSMFFDPVTLQSTGSIDLFFAKGKNSSGLISRTIHIFRHENLQLLQTPEPTTDHSLKAVFGINSAALHVMLCVHFGVFLHATSGRRTIQVADVEKIKKAGPSTPPPHKPLSATLSKTKKWWFLSTKSAGYPSKFCMT